VQTDGYRVDDEESFYGMAGGSAHQLSLTRPAFQKVGQRLAEETHCRSRRTVKAVDAGVVDGC
jgi:hypothetical protein